MSRSFNCGEFSIGGKTETACNTCLENGCNWCLLEITDEIRTAMGNITSTNNDNGYCYAAATPSQFFCESYQGQAIDQDEYAQLREEACLSEDARSEKRMIELIVFLLNAAIFGGIIWCVYRRWKMTHEMRESLLVHPHRHGTHVTGPGAVVQVAEATVASGPRVVHVQPMDDNYTAVSTNDNVGGQLGNSNAPFGTDSAGAVATTTGTANEAPPISSFGNYGGRGGHRLSIASPENYTRTSSSTNNSNIEMTPAVATTDHNYGSTDGSVLAAPPLGAPPTMITATAIAVTPRGTPLDNRT